MTELWIFKHTALPHENEHKCADIQLRMLLAERLSICPESLVFERTQYGKPYLKMLTPLYFNVSYTQGAFIIALSHVEVGADVERLRAGKPRVAERCFTNAEKAYLYEDEHLFHERFYELWTQKEAYLKYSGCGFYKLPQQTDVVCGFIRHYIHTFYEDDLIISVCGLDMNPLCIYQRLV